MGGLKVLYLVMFASFAAADRKPTIAEKLAEDADLSQVFFILKTLISFKTLRVIKLTKVCYNICLWHGVISNLSVMHIKRLLVKLV